MSEINSNHEFKNEPPKQATDVPKGLNENSDVAGAFAKSVKKLGYRKSYESTEGSVSKTPQEEIKKAEPAKPLSTSGVPRTTPETPKPETPKEEIKKAEKVKPEASSPTPGIGDLPTKEGNTPRSKEEEKSMAIKKNREETATENRRRDEFSKLSPEDQKQKRERMNPEEKLKDQAWKNEKDQGNAQRAINMDRKKVEEHERGDPLLKVGDAFTGFAYEGSLKQDLENSQKKKETLGEIGKIYEKKGPYENFTPEQKLAQGKAEERALYDNSQGATDLSKKLADMASDKAETGAKAARVVQDINAYAGTVAVTTMRGKKAGVATMAGLRGLGAAVEGAVETSLDGGSTGDMAKNALRKGALGTLKGGAEGSILVGGGAATKKLLDLGARKVVAGAAGATVIGTGLGTQNEIIDAAQGGTSTLEERATRVLKKLPIYAVTGGGAAKLPAGVLPQALGGAAIGGGSAATSDLIDHGKTSLASIGTGIAAGVAGGTVNAKINTPKTSSTPKSNTEIKPQTITTNTGEGQTYTLNPELSPKNITTPKAPAAPAASPKVIKEPLGQEPREPVAKGVVGAAEDTPAIRYDGRPLKVAGVEVLTTRNMTPESRKHLEKIIPALLEKNPDFLSTGHRSIVGQDGSEFKLRKPVYGPNNPDDYAPPIEKLPLSKNMGPEEITHYNTMRAQAIQDARNEQLSKVATRNKPSAQPETKKHSNRMTLRENPLPPIKGNRPNPEVLNAAPRGKPYRPFEGANNGTPYEVGKYKVRTDTPLTPDQETRLRKVIPEYIEQTKGGDIPRGIIGGDGLGFKFRIDEE